MVRLLCDSEKISTVLNTLKLSFEKTDKIQLTGYDFTVEEDLRFYFSQTDTTETRDFDVLSISKENVWCLDKFQSCLIYKKEVLQKNGEEYLIYTKRSCTDIRLQSDSLQKLSDCCKNDLQMRMCDIYLMIPGKINTGDNRFSEINITTHTLFDIFAQNIESSIQAEYSSDILKNMERKCISETVIKISSVDGSEEFYQPGLLGCVLHKSGFCILEIMLPCCIFGGNKLLNYYCGEFIEIKLGDCFYSINGLLKELGIRRFGKKRSMVFAYGNISEEEKINALANEEFPMGQINGEFFSTISHRNIAQYDTAKVFVSEETVLEVCKYINIFPDKRILYHVIEIFFVEMILFQDAAIDKVHYDLHNICTDNFSDISLATKRSDEISKEMTEALKFADYSCFLFPTVRESARIISKAFGIDHIYEKYEKDKYLIDTIIQSNSRKAQEKQDIIKNRFLFLISALSTIGVLGEIIHFFFEDAFTSAFSYISALLITSVFFIVYKLIIKLRNK